MTLVVDASVVVAALIDGGTHGVWAEDLLLDDLLVAPQHIPAEVTSGLRQAAASGVLPATVADAAHDQLVALPVDLPVRPPVVPHLESAAERDGVRRLVRGIGGVARCRPCNP